MGSSTLPVSSVHVRSNRMDLLGRLAGDLAHEVRNPLHAIAINLELARRRAVAKTADAVIERLDIVEEEVDRIHRLVDSLMLVLRTSRGEPRTPILESLEQLRPLIQVQARMSRAELIWDVPAPESLAADGSAAPSPDLAIAVPMHRSDWAHSLLNLIANALEATPAGRKRLEVQVSMSELEVDFRVRDSGSGFSAEAAANFGAPGFSTRPGHAGFGIAVARTLVEEAGGRLLLEATGSGGVGACTRIVLPLARSA
jgi:signal transduction histidine kinase